MKIKEAYKLALTDRERYIEHGELLGGGIMHL